MNQDCLIECIQTSSWELTNVNDNFCMTRKVGNEIEVRNCTLRERFCEALHNIGSKLIGMLR